MLNLKIDALAAWVGKEDNSFNPKFSNGKK